MTAAHVRWHKQHELTTSILATSLILIRVKVHEARKQPLKLVCSWGINSWGVVRILVPVVGSWLLGTSNILRVVSSFHLVPSCAERISRIQDPPILQVSALLWPYQQVHVPVGLTSSNSSSDHPQHPMLVLWAMGVPEEVFLRTAVSFYFGATEWILTCFMLECLEERAWKGRRTIELRVKVACITNEEGIQIMYIQSVKIVNLVDICQMSTNL